MANEIVLNIMSLNCWGIPYVSKNRIARMQAIGEKILNDNYDIVCLQEVWSLKDYNRIKSKVQDKLPHSHYFLSGVVGSGVCVLSKYPIEDVMFHKWAVNGYVHKIHHGDWFGGKGVGLCRINVQNLSVNVYTAHLHAEYNRENDEYMAHRVLQAFDTAQFIKMTMGGADAAILGGDLNTEPEDLAYRIISTVAGLTDSCSNHSNLGTNECAKNSYTNVKLGKTAPNGKRIDYILYLGSKQFKVDVSDFEHPFPDRVPHQDFSYSDHEAILASLRIKKGEYQTNRAEASDLLREAMTTCEHALDGLQSQRLWYMIASLLLVIPLVWSIGLDYASDSLGASIGFNIIRILLSAVLCYAVFMSTIWNSVERNAIKAGCLAMEVQLRQNNKNL